MTKYLLLIVLLSGLANAEERVTTKQKKTKPFTAITGQGAYSVEIGICFPKKRKVKNIRDVMIVRI